MTHPQSAAPSPHHARALILLALTAMLWSTGGFLIKLIQWNALCIAGVRSAIAALCLALLSRNMQWNPFLLTRYERYAALVYTSTVVLFVAATKLTTAANAILLQYTAPIYVALFGAWFLGEKTSRMDWLTLGIVIPGMILFFVEGLSSTGMLGNALAILSGLSFAWLTLFMRKDAQERQHYLARSEELSEELSEEVAKQQNSGVNAVFWGNILTALLGAPFVLMSYLQGSAPSGSEAWQSWLGLALLGIFQLGISYMIYSRAIIHVSALEAILIPVIEPLLNPLWVALITGETPGVYALAGGALVIAAITFRSIVSLRLQYRSL